MFTIRIDFANRLFTLCGDGEPVVSFRRYREAAALLVDLRSN
jgi:hypothetical protein